MKARGRTFAALAALGALAPANALADGTPYQLEVGPIVGLAKHTAASDGSGVGYDTGTAFGALFRAWFVPWLRGSARFVQSRHAATFAPGALGVTGTLSGGDVTVDAISAHIQPTWSPTLRLHLWASLGIGWNHLGVPNLDTSTGAHLRERSGIFAQVPLGVGGGFDVVRWVTASVDLAWAPAFAPSGDLFSPDLHYDAAGKPQPVGPFPHPTSSLYAMATVAFAL